MSSRKERRVSWRFSLALTVPLLSAGILLTRLYEHQRESLAGVQGAVEQGVLTKDNIGLMWVVIILVVTIAWLRVGHQLKRMVLGGSFGQ